MKKTFRLTDEEHKKLVELYTQSQRTPAILVGGTRDLASLAWEETRKYMDELGKKYGYHPETAAISKGSLEFEAEKI